MVSVPEAMNDPRLRRFRLRRLRIPVGAGQVDLVVPDARAWLREGAWVGATERGAEPPYWVNIWPASVAVARALVREVRPAGKGVLDLGCGLGVPGVVAASAGAAVTFADQQEDALAFASWNAERAHPERARPRCERLDWQRTVVAGRFDVLVLADVSYRLLHHAPLLRHVDQCLAPGGIVLHADPFRHESDTFLKALAQRLCVGQVEQQVHFDGRRVAVRLACAARSRDELPAAFLANVAGSGASPGGSPMPNEPSSAAAAPDERADGQQRGGQA